MEIISLKTNSKNQILDLTNKIDYIIKKSMKKDGICFIFCPHTTAALSINENADPSVKEDILNSYGQIVKEGKNYLHMEGNATAHIKTVMTGSSLNIFIENGELKLGTWQGIYFCEFDGPRNREVWVKII